MTHEYPKKPRPPRVWRPRGWEPDPEVDERAGPTGHEVRATKRAAFDRAQEQEAVRVRSKQVFKIGSRAAAALMAEIPKQRGGPAGRPDPRLMTEAQLAAMAKALMLAQHYDWPWNARPEQVEPEDYKIWLMLAGRGWGKTKTLAETIRKWCQTPGVRVGVIAQDHKSLRDTVFENGLLLCIPEDEIAEYKRGLGDVSLRLKNGSMIRGYTAGQPESLRGPEFDGLAFDELAAWPKNLAEETMSNARLAMRNVKEGFGKIIIATTPRRVEHLMTLVKAAKDPEAGIVITKGKTSDNPYFGEEQRKALEYTYGGSRRARQELGGELLDDVDGSLWTLEGIEEARWPSGEDLPKFDYVITGVDPSGSAGGDSTGCVTLAYVRALKQIWVLECASTGGLAEHRYNEVCRSAYRNHADLIVVEGAFSGDNARLAVANQWKHLVQVGEIDTPCPRIEPSNIKGDKVAKASPVAQLFEQQLNHPEIRRIWHLQPTPENQLAKLEDQMTIWQPTDKKSPDSIDALSHAGRRALRDMGLETMVGKPGKDRRWDTAVWNPFG